MDEGSLCIVFQVFVLFDMSSARCYKVEHVLSHYCSMWVLCTVVALLAVLRWWPRRGGYCFTPFCVLSLFFYCVVLRRLLEYCLVA
jgi:hypothetical protein